MEKQTVGHIAVSGIIYRAANPEEIFIDMKDATYPHVVWRGCLCLIGGNWIGKEARYDTSPLMTFAREVGEELSLDKRVQSTAELVELSVHTTPINYVVKGIDRKATREDCESLEYVEQAIIHSARSFGDYISTIPREVFLRGDTTSRQTAIVSLFCVFDVGLNEEMWAMLARLGRDFGNLSCESESRILSVDDIIEKNIIAMAGYDYILQDFFECKGVMRQRVLPMDPAVKVRRASVYPRRSYKSYLRHYFVTKKPEGW